MIHDVDEDRTGLKVLSWTFNSNVGETLHFRTRTASPGRLKGIPSSRGMDACTYGGYPMPNTHNWSIQAVRTLFSFGLWGAAEAGYNFHSDLAPSATSREGDSASESCPYRPRNDTSWSSYYPNTTSESRERPSL